MDLKSLIRDIPDFPKPGIVFRDITTLLNHPQGLRYTIDTLTAKCRDYGLSPDYIVGMESRGFLFGVPLAYQLEAGFIPVRKPGKLPAAVHSIEYDLEYGSDSLEIHQDAVASHQKNWLRGVRICLYHRVDRPRWSGKTTRFTDYYHHRLLGFF